ncbi:MAG: Lrp/AsnC ligand binding domain-containing protein [Candidatus Odinarchaeota archaeon]
MPGAYVLINVDTGAEQAVLECVKSVPHVIDARAVYGAYDIICLVEAATVTELKEIIKDKLRQIDQVRSTFTILQM